MSDVVEQVRRIEDDALAMFTEWWDLSSTEVPMAEFCRDLTRAIVVNTLKWAAADMRSAGPTIAAIMLEETARDAEIAARAA